MPISIAGALRIVSGMTDVSPVRQYAIVVCGPRVFNHTRYELQLGYLPATPSQRKLDFLTADVSKISIFVSWLISVSNVINLAHTCIEPSISQSEFSSPNREGISFKEC